MRKKNLIAALVTAATALVLVAAVIPLASCKEDRASGGAKTGQAQEIKLKDGMGNDVSLENTAKKIIVFTPSALEILDAIGAIDYVIGVDNWSIDFGEPLAAGFEGFGDFQSLNMEKITASDPDIIIGLIGWAEADIQKLNELGIKIYIVDANTIDEVYTDIINMGQLTGMQKEAQELKVELEKKVNAVTEKVKDISQEQKPKVFYEVWNDPLMSAGSDTFINEFIEKAGGINIVTADGLSGWPEYSVENLIQNNPDVIIAPMSLAPDADVIISDARFSSVNAVINKKVYIVPDNPVSRPSQNIIKGLEMFAQAIHPEIFGEFTVQQ
ncbi:MAG: ABC transporter substrate-binding protein [Actinobacteria bacterium]|nr:ABC transporter substrate-binding protein [Actinomycetota bacterium]